MTQLSWKKLLLGFLVVLVLSRAGRIIEFLKEVDMGGILTLEPLRRTPEDGRCLITLTLIALAMVLLHSWFFRGRK